MADPVIDETQILSLLSAPVGPHAVARLQAGAVQALVDLYDRKCTREEFINLASPCLALYGSAAKLWLLHNIHEVHVTGDLDEARFKLADEGLADLVRVQSEAVIDIVKRLQLCPRTQDTVN